MRVFMSKKVEHRKLYSNETAQSEKQTCAVESITEQPEEDQPERQRRKIGKRVVQALQELTEAGVVVWRVGEGWARACLSVRFEEQKYVKGISRVVWLTNDHAIDDRGEPSETFFVLERNDHDELADAIYQSLFITEVVSEP